jgi:hypothetical protein
MTGPIDSNGEDSERTSLSEIELARRATRAMSLRCHVLPISIVIESTGGRNSPVATNLSKREI